MWRRLALVTAVCLLGGWQPAKPDFAGAYDRVKAGTDRAATAGKYALRDLGRGIVRITDESRPALERAGDAIGDAWITTKVKAQLAANRHVKASEIEVTTDHGVVKLAGTVDDALAAERAIQIALETSGVRAVDADLKYPTRFEHTRGQYPDGPRSYQ